MQLGTIIWYVGMGILGLLALHGLLWGVSQPSAKERLHNEIIIYQENIKDCYRTQNKTFSAPAAEAVDAVPALKARRAAHHAELVACYTAQFQRK